MPIRLPSAAAACLIASLAACSDEPSVRAPEELLGRWEERGLSGSLLGEWTFLDDGTYRFVDPSSGGERGGTYSADDRELVTEGSSGVQTVTYFAAGDVVLLRALLPDRASEDPIGTWRGGSLHESEDGSDRYENTLTVREGGSATFTQEITFGADGAPAADVWVLDGAWAVEGERLVVREEGASGLETSIDFFFVSGGALGETRLSRLPGDG